MSPLRRIALCAVVLTCGLGAETGLENLSRAPRPPLKRPLHTIPYRLGDWVGEDEPVDPRIIEESQSDDYLNRVYQDQKHPGRRLTVWINYSVHGLNMRHSPEVCLPSTGWTKVEARSRVMTLELGDGRTLPISRLAYARGELVQGLGFWYYIFGEGRIERFVRTLPLTSRSSHGRTTRGSGLTVEVFCPGDWDPDGAALQDFARSLLAALEPILPEDRANYYIP
jgi:EpsI family protein